MAVNRGKDFEGCIKASFESAPDTAVVRLIDPQNGYAGVRNVCDFVVYHKPYMYFIECKSVHGDKLSIHGLDVKRKYGALTNNQWEGMLEYSKIDGVIAGVVVWFIDHDITKFFPIQMLAEMRDSGYRSVKLFPSEWSDIGDKYPWQVIWGDKRRVLFDYDMTEFFDKMEKKVIELGTRSGC